MRHMFRRAHRLSLLMFLALMHTANADAQLARQAVATLAAEATASIKDDQPFPRTEPDYAQPDTEALTGDEVVRLLQKPLDRNPVVDAYVKWQLLSYKPDLDAVRPVDALRLIEAMPAFEPSGQLAKSDRNFVNRYANRDDIPAAHARRLIELGQRFHHGQLAIIQRNEPNDAYRDALIEALPDDHGLKLHAMIRDVEQRMIAGNRSWGSRIDRMFKKCEELGQSGSLSPAARAQLTKRIQRLTRITNERFVNFKPMAGNRVDVTTQRIVFGDKRFRRACDALDGKAAE